MERRQLTPVGAFYEKIDKNGDKYLIGDFRVTVMLYPNKNQITSNEAAFNGFIKEAKKIERSRATERTEEASMSGVWSDSSGNSSY